MSSSKFSDIRINEKIMAHNAEMDKRILSDTIAVIDSILGDGYARRNPDLIGTIILARAKRCQFAID